MGRGVGIEPLGLARQLALQRLGEGRDADAARRLVDPLLGGGEIAERLADAGAGLGDEHLRRVPAIARGEDRGGRAGVILLSGAALGAVAGEPVEPRGDVSFVDRHLARRAARRLLLPLGEAGEEPPVIGVRAGEARLDERRPRPALARQRLDAVPRAFAFGPVGIGEAGEHRRRGLGQEGGDVFLGLRRRQPDGGGDPRRGRHREARGVEKSEKLEQVEPREFGIAEPVAGERRVQEQVRRCRDGGDRLAAPDALDAAVRVGDPDADMARVDRGQSKRVGRHRPTLGTKGERGKADGSPAIPHPFVLSLSKDRSFLLPTPKSCPSLLGSAPFS